jgi:hypothetical protein
MKVHLPYPPPKTGQNLSAMWGNPLEKLHVLKINEFLPYCNPRSFNPFYGPKPPLLCIFYGTPPTLDHNWNPKSATSIGLP